MKEKPVLWQWLDTVQVRKKVPDCFIKSDWRPLYKTPQTKPLSDEEIKEVEQQVDKQYAEELIYRQDEWVYLFARAIEERHGIK